MAKILPCVIVGMEGNGLGVARSLRRGGIPSIAIGLPEWNPAYLTRTASIRRLSTWSKQALIEQLLAVSKELGERVPLILTKDEAVIWVSEERSIIQQHFVIPLPDHQIVLRLMDKRLFHSWAESAGLPIPRTRSIATAEEAATAGRELTFPLVLKPSIKNEAFRSSWLPKAFRVESSEELLASYFRISQFEREAVAQEWIEGGDNHVVFALGYWNSHSIPLDMFYGQKIRQWPLNHGNTAHCIPAPNDWAELIQPLVDRIGSECGFQGLNSVEFKIDSRSNKPLITEPTVCRTDYQSEVAVLNGVNLPLTAYRDALGLPVARSFAGRAVRWIDARADLKAGKKLIRAGQLTVSDFVSSYRGRKAFVFFRAGDPLPWLGRQLPVRISSRM